MPRPAPGRAAGQARPVLLPWLAVPRRAALQISEEEKAVTEGRLAEFEAEIRRAIKSKRVQVRHA